MCSFPENILLPHWVLQMGIYPLNEETLKYIKLRIFGKEALTNIVKHSKAKTADMTLKKVYHWIEMEIRDDGRGVVPQQKHRTKKQGSGIGLQGIQERGELSGGDFTLWSAPVQGPVIRVLCLLE